MEPSCLIVVGVDGSAAGARALRWAVEEAVARGGTVQVVTAWNCDRVVCGPDRSYGPDRDEARAQAVRLLDEEIATLTGGLAQTDRLAQVDVLPPIDVLPPVDALAVEGSPPEVLTTAARSADLLVLGSHGHSRLHHTMLGSVSEECIRTANCPVVVIPAPLERRAAVHPVPETSLAPGRELPLPRPSMLAGACL